MRRHWHGLAIGLVFALAACGTGERKQSAAGEQESAGTAMNSAGGMRGMAGMDGQMGDRMNGGAMEAMQQHMQRMMGASADSMQSMMPMHRQMTANMLSTMNREMRDMQMTGDAAWTATMDSIRQDLVRMPEMSPEELRALMPGHRDRVMRLMVMHRSMMANMKM